MDISIVITAYNYEAYLEECLDSCLFQDPSGLEYEVIVVDDGSTDKSPDILRGRSDRRLKKYRQENGGIERASNFGFKEAKGRYVVRVDADDRLSPRYLHDIRPYLDEEAGFFYPDYAVIDAEGQITENVDLPEFQEEEICQRGDFLATGTLYSADVLREAGDYATEIRNSGLENYELILRLIRSGVKGRHVPRRLFFYRRHALNISETKKAQIIRNGHSLFARMGMGPYTTNAYHPYKLKVGEE